MEPAAPSSLNSSSMSMKYVNEGGAKGLFKKWWGILVAIVPVFILWMWLTNPMVVIVDGYGEVEAQADSTVLTYSVIGSGQDPATAIANVNARVAALESVLSGVAPSDISKSQLQVAPNTTQGGWQALISVGVKSADTSGIESLVSSLYSAGASAVSQPILSVDEPESYENEAYELALDDAKEKAAEIGGKNLKFIRKITGISQTAATSTSTATKNPDYSTEAENPETVSSGVFKISKTVTVSYKMW